jgi:hypothetical protein
LRTHLDRLQGYWRRSLIEWPSGDRDVTTQVTWLQGPRCFVDLRQPVPFCDYGCVRNLRDLDATQLEALALQEGFAGILIQHEDCFEWTRQIDFQPKPRHADKGTLDDQGDRLVEHGYDVDYVEHWHRDDGERAPAGALTLRDRRTGVLGMMVGVGPHFMFARGRKVSLDESRPLLDYVRAAPSLIAAQDIIDCELSFGSNQSGWRIERSSLPYRVGVDLSPRYEGGSLFTRDVMPNGVPGERSWAILAQEGDLSKLLGTSETVSAYGET